MESFLFTIADQCPPEQKRLFQAINEGLKVFGISANEYDRLFRILLMQNCLVAAASTQTGILAQSDPRTSIGIKNSALEKWYNTNPLAARGLDLHKIFTDLLTSDGLMEVKLSKKLTTPEEIRRFMNMVATESEKQKILSAMIGELNNQIGRFQDIGNPDNEALAEIYRDFNKNAKLPLRSSSSHANILRACANGEPITNDRHSFCRYEISGLKFETPELRFYVTHALLNAFYYLIKQQPERDIDRFTELLRPHANIISDSMDKLGGASTDLSILKNNPIAAQKDFFKLLGSICHEYEISELFDYNLRSRLGLLLVNSGTRAYVKTAKLMEEDLGIPFNTNIIRANTSLDDAVNKLSITAKHLTDPATANAVKIGAPAPDPISDKFALDDIQSAIGHNLFNKYVQRFPNLPCQKLTVECRIVPPDVVERVDKKLTEIERYTGDVFKIYDQEKRLLADFEKEGRLLYTLSNQPTTYQWHQYLIDMPSEREYLITAIKETVRHMVSYERRSRGDQKNIDKTLRALEEAYNLALRSPQEWEVIEQEKQEKAKLAEQRNQGRQEAERERAAAATAANIEKQRLAEEARQRQLAEQQKQEEEAKLNFIPFKPAGPAQSVIDRGKTPALADIVGPQIKPLIDHLNSNFPPHKALGELLFTAGNGQVMRNIDYVCGTGKHPVIDTEIHQGMKKEIAQLLSMTLGDSPVDKANREHHAEAVKTLAMAPIVLIAALGTLNDLQSARHIRELQHPSHGKQPDDKIRAGLNGAQAALAVQILEREQIPVSEALREEAAQAAMPAPPAKKSKSRPLPPPPSAKTPSSPPASPVIALPENPAAMTIPTLMLAAATLAATQDTKLTAPEDTTNAIAAAIKPSPPAVELTPPAAEPPVAAKPVSPPNGHNGMHNPDKIMADLDRFVEERKKEKYNMLRCDLSREGGYPLTISLSRWVNGNGSGQQRTETRSITRKLNVQNIEEALQLKQEILTKLLAPDSGIHPYRHRHGDNILTGNDTPLPFCAPERDASGLAGHLGDRGGIWTLHLRFPTNGEKANGPLRTEGVISLGLKQNGNKEEARHRQELVSEYIDKLLSSPDRRRFTMQDLRLILQDKVAHENRPWERPDKINLAEHPEIEKQIVIDFPSKENQSVIKIGNPTLDGKPNLFWRIPLVIGAITPDPKHPDDLMEIAKLSINTHVIDPDDALHRAEKALRHFKESLEKHAHTYPGATWQLKQLKSSDPDQEEWWLDREPSNISSNLINISGAAWDHIVSQLGYICQLSAHPSNIKEHEGRTSFKLALRRADGTSFLAKQDIPAECECFLPSKAPPQETRRAITAFCRDVRKQFATYMEDHFKKKPQEIDGKPVYIPPDSYNAATIDKQFYIIAKAAAADAGITVETRRTSGLAGKRHAPGVPKEHHADGAPPHGEGFSHREFVRERKPGLGFDLS